ncbi:unnamed protein product [Chrysodeixis includens]|uniref:Uncharacterized protein n=1 Tax=Chrysodeixis includens TaxID=689277 RepID=A0A9N8Q1X6_CHRIL|nr:unnamed protein product [Chrysodeixis includens]
MPDPIIQRLQNREFISKLKRPAIRAVPQPLRLRSSPATFAGDYRNRSGRRSTGLFATAIARQSTAERAGANRRGCGRPRPARFYKLPAGAAGAANNRTVCGRKPRPTDPFVGKSDSQLLALYGWVSRILDDEFCTIASPCVVHDVDTSLRLRRRVFHLFRHHCLVAIVLSAASVMYTRLAALAARRGCWRTLAWCGEPRGASRGRLHLAEIEYKVPIIAIGAVYPTFIEFLSVPPWELEQWGSA